MGGVGDGDDAMNVSSALPLRRCGVEEAARKEVGEETGRGDEAEPASSVASAPVSEAAARAAVTDSASDASEAVSVVAGPVQNMDGRREEDGEGEGDGEGDGDDGRDLPKTDRRARDGRTDRPDVGREVDSKRRRVERSSRFSPGDQVGCGDWEEGGVEPGEGSALGDTRRDEPVDRISAGVVGT